MKLDILYNPYSNQASSVLSNLYPKPFSMCGLQFGSIEGFLQGLKFENIEAQRAVFSMSGITAKLAGSKVKIKNQTLFYNGLPFDRHSDFYQDLLDNVYDLCYSQSEYFRLAIEETLNCNYTHTIGKTDPLDTILTIDEFLTRLNTLKQYHGIKV